MPTTILLIRHGQTDWNIEGRWQGQTDTALNSTGLVQGRALAKRLATWSIQALYSSDLQRAAQTAALIGEELGLSPIFDAAWRERSFGALEGLTMAEVAALYPAVYTQMKRGHFMPPGGENSKTLQDRVVAALEHIVDAHAGQSIAVVSHGGALRALLAHILLLSPGEHGRLGVGGNAGISQVEIDGTRPRLLLLNDTAHLEQWSLSLLTEPF